MDSTTSGHSETNLGDDVVFLPQLQPEAVVVDLLDDSFVFDNSPIDIVDGGANEGSSTTPVSVVKNEVTVSALSPPAKKTSAASTSKKRSLETISSTPEQAGAGGESGSRVDGSDESPVQQPRKKVARKEETETPQRSNALLRRLGVDNVVAFEAKEKTIHPDQMDDGPSSS